jgi:hypothetical protein
MSRWKLTLQQAAHIIVPLDFANQAMLVGFCGQAQRAPPDQPTTASTSPAPSARMWSLLLNTRTWQQKARQTDKFLVLCWQCETGMPQQSAHLVARQ